jgi:hypothetical protein
VRVPQALPPRGQVRQGDERGRHHSSGNSAVGHGLRNRDHGHRKPDPPSELGQRQQADRLGDRQADRKHQLPRNRPELDRDVEPGLAQANPSDRCGNHASRLIGRQLTQLGGLQEPGRDHDTVPPCCAGADPHLTVARVELEPWRAEALLAK